MTQYYALASSFLPLPPHPTSPLCSHIPPPPGGRLPAWAGGRAAGARASAGDSGRAVLHTRHLAARPPLHLGHPPSIQPPPTRHVHVNHAAPARRRGQAPRAVDSQLGLPRVRPLGRLVIRRLSFRLSSQPSPRVPPTCRSGGSAGAGGNTSADEFALAMCVGGVLRRVGVSTVAASGHTLAVTPGGVVLLWGRDWDARRRPAGLLGRADGAFWRLAPVEGLTGEVQVVAVATGNWAGQSRARCDGLWGEGEVWKGGGVGEDRGGREREEAEEGGRWWEREASGSV
ncbi:unnamed protein product [Closterium sp. Naga37s-1]|nr:unnamed protein product [Closterium sp. Naga37s-1]